MDINFHRTGMYLPDVSGETLTRVQFFAEIDTIYGTTTVTSEA